MVATFPPYPFFFKPRLPFYECGIVRAKWGGGEIYNILLYSKVIVIIYSICCVFLLLFFAGI